MEFFIAMGGAVLVYFIVAEGLNVVFAKRVKLEKRLKSLDDLKEEDLAEKSISVWDIMLKPTLGFLISTIAALTPNNASELERREEQLRQAGIRMPAKEYNAAVILLTVGLMVGFTFIAILQGQPVGRIILFPVFGLYAGVVLARFHLKSKIKRRKDEIYHQLPETMDLLSVSVSAGLGFDQALTYIVQKSKGALIQEFEIAQRQISLGRARKEALEQLAARCDNMELHTFVSAVLQADEIGASMHNILQIQASTIRETHRQNVEEKAQKLSTKMLIPLVLFIFPVLFIILLGPAVPMIMQGLGGV